MKFYSLDKCKRELGKNYQSDIQTHKLKNLIENPMSKNKKTNKHCIHNRGGTLTDIAMLKYKKD